MKRFRFAFSLAIFLISLFLVYPSFAEEKQKLYVGRYQLVAAQYKDSNGEVRPVVYRIDTMTGNTSRIVYLVISGFKESEKVGAFAFEEVYKDEPAFYLHMERLKRVLEKK